MFYSELDYYKAKNLLAILEKPYWVYLKEPIYEFGHVPLYSRKVVHIYETTTLSETWRR